VKKRTGLYPAVQADAAGAGVVSHAGGVALVETVRAADLDVGLSEALTPWRKPTAVHDPGKVLLDLAVSLALGGDCLADIAVLRAEPGVYGRVASDPTVSRTIDTLAADAPRALAAINTARSAARARVWKLAGKHAPDHQADADRPLVVDVDATLVTAHSPGSGTRSLRVRPLATWSDGVFRRVAIFEAISGSVRYRLANPGDRKVGTGAGPVEGGVRRSGGHRAAFGRLRSIGVPVVVLGGVRGLAGRSWLQPGHDGELERDPGEVPDRM